MAGCKQRAKQHDPAAARNLPHHCQYCGLAFASPKAHSCHVTACRKRRLQAWPRGYAFELSRARLERPPAQLCSMSYPPFLTQEHPRPINGHSVSQYFPAPDTPPPRPTHARTSTPRKSRRPLWCCLCQQPVHIPLGRHRRSFGHLAAAARRHSAYVRTLTPEMSRRGLPLALSPPTTTATLPTPLHGDGRGRVG